MSSDALIRDLEAVLIREFAPSEYEELCRVMINTPFYSDIRDDANRVEDALDLRYDLMDWAREDLIPASLFEVLASLLQKMDFMLDRRFGVRYLMEEIMKNAGLDAYTNKTAKRDLLGFEEDLRIDLDDILNHDIAPNGEGGFFPCLNIPNDYDQRTAGLWRSMNDYVASEFEV